MPGLLRGMARTAVVAGTATAVSNRVSRRQAQRWGYADQSATYAEPEPAPAAAPPQADPIAQLKELASLKNQGILTEEEFAAQKAKILGS
jgi:Short C-terminal domain